MIYLHGFVPDDFGKGITISMILKIKQVMFLRLITTGLLLLVQLFLKYLNIVHS